MNDERHPVHLSVLVGSDREGRFGPVVAGWFEARARRRGDLRVTLLDVAELGVPSRLPAGAHPAVDAYARRLDVSDAFVVVTPSTTTAIPPR